MRMRARQSGLGQACVSVVPVVPVCQCASACVPVPVPVPVPVVPVCQCPRDPAKGCRRWIWTAVDGARESRSCGQQSRVEAADYAGSRCRRSRDGRGDGGSGLGGAASTHPASPWAPLHSTLHPSLAASPAHIAHPSLAPLAALSTLACPLPTAQLAETRRHVVAGP